jgi:hypothetical protein
MCFRRSLLFCFALGASSAGAQEYQQGIGVWSCQKFVPAIFETEGQVAAYSWAMGYIAGINTAKIIDFANYFDVSEIDDVTVLSHMIAFCRSHPNLPVIAAVDSLLPRLPVAVWSDRK